MKITATDQVDIQYPKLMISHNSLIVFFSAKKTGMVITDRKSNYNVGYYSTQWDMDNFRDYVGKVELSNEG